MAGLLHNSSKALLCRPRRSSARVFQQGHRDAVGVHRGGAAGVLAGERAMPNDLIPISGERAKEVAKLVANP
jgi:hypothetical protein